MNIRPRRHEWLPLQSQQLRLRNLQSIQGINIELNLLDLSVNYTDVLLYFTLHDHPENEAFYQSEMQPLRIHLPQKWAEIQCPAIQSNANCVCIKIWAWIKKTEAQQEKEYAEVQLRKKMSKEIKEPISALTREFAKSHKPQRPPDKLILSWAVYFSGLIPFSQYTEAKCSKNSLVFQMNDDYFTSPEHFSTENLREQLALNYQRYSASVPKCSIPTPDELNINSPHVSRSSSPISLVDWQKDLLKMSRTRYAQLNCARTEIRNSYDLTKLLRLQQLQRQRLLTLRESVELAADIKRLSLRCITKEQLLRKPRTTSTSSSLTASSYSSNYHSMGRKLSQLLAEQQQINPHQLLQARHLQQQVESLKCKQRLLQNAQETYSKRITYLRQQLAAARTAREHMAEKLSASREKLKDNKYKHNLEQVYLTELFRKKRIMTQRVERRIAALCVELKEIYPISRNHKGFFTICAVAFPPTEGYIQNSNNAQSVFISENISPMALSASLGYVAHLIQMISVVINRPLRNPIIHQGSNTRIVDIIKEIPFTSREFPLYSRSSIPTKPVRYAIYLLNQNIAQLCFDITGIRCDMRATIENLSSIFETFELQQIRREIQDHYVRSVNKKRLQISDADGDDGGFILQQQQQQQQQQLASDAVDGNNHFDYANINRINDKNGGVVADDSLSKSHSSVDMNHIQPPRIHHVPSLSLANDKLLMAARTVSHPIDIQQLDRSSSLNSQRISRSAGSYPDSEEDCHSSTVNCFSNSDSNLKMPGRLD